jgi:hypothetical protein
MKRKLISNILTTSGIVLIGLMVIFCSKSIFEANERCTQERYIEELRFQNIDTYLDVIQQR